jgi:hypothetical protein
MKMHIFKAGEHVSAEGVRKSWTRSDLEAIAQSYDPALSEAPLVIGHPKGNGPAYGWAERLSVEGDELWAEFGQIAEGVPELVSGGAYKKRSASIYPPNHPHNPKPGGWYLRHVGLLGAMPPAIKGLKDIALSHSEDGADCLTFEESEAPSMDVEKIRAELEASFAEKLQAAEANYAQRAQAVDLQLAAIAERERKLRRAELASFCESLKSQGRLTPAMEAAGVLDFMSTLAEAETISFGEATVSQLGMFKQVLGAMPPVVEFGEVAGKGKDVSGDPAAKLDAATKALMAQDKSLTYGEALLAAQAANPGLVAAYEMTFQRSK